MAMWVIPIDNAATNGAWSQTVDLANEEFKLDFQWNSREGFWYFNLSDASESLIKAGIKIVTNFTLTSRITDIRKPAGNLIAIDTRETDGIPAQDPGLEDLGVNVELIFVEDGTLDE